MIWGNTDERLKKAGKGFKEEMPLWLTLDELEFDRQRGSIFHGLMIRRLAKETVRSWVWLECVVGAGCWLGGKQGDGRGDKMTCGAKL